MKNKGFTLIELLAVIVILAIIALIATPIILNIIDNTKEESVKRSIDHYLSAATTAIAAKNLNNVSSGVNPNECTIGTDGNLSCDGTPITVEVDGEKPTGGTIYFQNGKIQENSTIEIGGNTYKVNANGEIVLEGEGSGESLAKVCSVAEDNGVVGILDMGDEILCQKNYTTDKFYVIETTESTISMLTYYNLNPSTNTQGTDDEGMASKYKIDFSNSIYWSEAGYVYNTNSNAYTIIENFVTRLKNIYNLGASTSGKLMSLDQAKALGCTDSSCISAQEWVLGNASYWLGSAAVDGAYAVSVSGTIMNCGLDGCYGVSSGTMAAGVRPVITIPRGNMQ